MTDRHIDDEALGWAIRMAEPDADWDAFVAWLEGDAGRSDRYDRAVAMLDDAAAAMTREAVPAPAAPMLAVPSPIVARPSRRRWIGGAIAAAVTGAVGLGVWTQMPQPYTVRTAPGEQRVVALQDGSSIALAGASTVRLDRRDARVATVERGEMLFGVRHDADRPFAVQVAGLKVVDLGTVFDVKTAAGHTQVAVAEGAVMVDPDGAAMRLGPGQAMVAEGTTLERRTVATADIGGWRQGRLAYDDAPLAEVAADLSRQLGRRVAVAPSLARRKFRGTLDMATVGRKPALLGTLLDVTVRQDAEGWTLEPRR
ncbi:FecR family protein [Sphingomonas gellani]|uniref:FecR family protein n=1 Tax=Sphingomonas gellani TaxID=1166340 RepID=A0A1H8DV83_9SPHN|nr:FecR domain-containing protein [Sphingomonas gellani]SEN11130.1 FecR family protein [Sphingomonas gellani]